MTNSQTSSHVVADEFMPSPTARDSVVEEPMAWRTPTPPLGSVTPEGSVIADFEPAPIAPQQPHLLTARLELLEAAEHLRAAREALAAVGLLDPARLPADVVAHMVDDARFKVIAGVEVFDNVGVRL